MFCRLLLAALALACARSEKLADGCARVYIDYGSNAGLQIRKLYEPHLFAHFHEGNPTEPIFHSVFGENRDDVCTFGFEAGPRHAKRLTSLERAFRGVGRRVTFFTNTAVTTENRNVSFYVMPDDAPVDGGAAMDMGAKGEDVGYRIKVEAVGIDMAEWMLREVIGRTLPASSPPAAILMKSDIEGNDMPVMDRLFDLGVLCQVHTVYGEHMDEPWLSRMRAQLTRQGCATQIILHDDEVGQGGEAFLKEDSPWFLPLPGG